MDVWGRCLFVTAVSQTGNKAGAEEKPKPGQDKNRSLMLPDDKP